MAAIRPAIRHKFLLSPAACAASAREIKAWGGSTFSFFRPRASNFESSSPNRRSARALIRFAKFSSVWSLHLPRVTCDCFGFVDPFDQLVELLTNSERVLGFFVRGRQRRRFHNFGDCWRQQNFLHATTHPKLRARQDAEARRRAA